MSTTKKILVIRFSSIGDIILTTPVVRALKKQLGIKVHFLTKASFASLLGDNPYIDKVHVLKDSLRDTIQALRDEQFDEIIDLHHNLRTWRIKIALNIKASSFRKLNFEKWLMVRFKINRLPNLHIVDRYMECVAHLGVHNDGDGLDYFFPPDAHLDIESAFDCKPGTYIAIVIGAAHQTKCMTADQIISLAQNIENPIILIGGKDEIPKANYVLQHVGTSKVKSGVGHLNLHQSASVIAQAGYVISHDTGMMHIAAALKKEQSVVWGNTIPGFGMTPYYGIHSIPVHHFEQNGLSCRPCSKLGYEQCPKGHFRCMMDHDLKQLASLSSANAEKKG